MRADGRRGVCRRRFRRGCTKRDPAARPAPDLVERNFWAGAPNQLWTADVTYMPTLEGWLYLRSSLMRSPAGCLAGRCARTGGASLSSTRSRWRSRAAGGEVAGVVHHSDQGAEYTSHAIELELRSAGIRASTRIDRSRDQRRR